MLMNRLTYADAEEEACEPMHLWQALADDSGTFAWRAQQEHRSPAPG